MNTTTYWTQDTVREAISYHPSLGGKRLSTWPEHVLLASQAGFAAIDFVPMQLEQMTEAEVSNLLRSAKLKAACVRLPVGFQGDDDTFRRDLARLPALARLITRLGALTMYGALPASSEIPKAELLPCIRNRVSTCATVLNQYGVRLAMEVLGPLHLRRQAQYECIWRLPEAIEFVHSCGGKVGLLLDAWHWHHSGGTVMDILDASSLIYHVHLADAPNVPADVVRDEQRLVPGAGILNFLDFFAGLRSIGYSGFFTPEILGYRGSSHSPVERVRRARIAVLDLIIANLVDGGPVVPGHDPSL